MKMSYHAYRRRVRRIECAADNLFLRALNDNDKFHLFFVEGIPRIERLKRQARRLYDRSQCAG